MLTINIAECPFSYQSRQLGPLVLNSCRLFRNYAIEGDIAAKM